MGHTREAICYTQCTLGHTQLDLGTLSESTRDHAEWTMTLSRETEMRVISDAQVFQTPNKERNGLFMDISRSHQEGGSDREKGRRTGDAKEEGSPTPATEQ